MELVSVVPVLFFFYKAYNKCFTILMSSSLIALGLHCCIWTFSTWGARASHCYGFSHCGARALGHIVAAAHGV